MAKKKNKSGPPPVFKAGSRYSAYKLAWQRKNYGLHPEYYREKARRWYWNNRDLCISRTKTWGMLHPDKLKETKRNTQVKLKETILSHYSPKLECQLCGFNDIRALSIDHINGNGNKHRKKIFGHNASGSKFYRWLKRNNYPDGFRVLCGNCQFTTYLYNRKISTYMQRYHHENKLTSISHYSPKLSCKRCSFNNIDGLTIDHVDGGGRAHLKNIKTDLYVWLRRNNFPSGYQVLCMNCNWIKRVENNESAKQ